MKHLFPISHELLGNFDEFSDFVGHGDVVWVEVRRGQNLRSLPTWLA